MYSDRVSLPRPRPNYSHQSTPLGILVSEIFVDQASESSHPNSRKTNSKIEFTFLRRNRNKSCGRNGYVGRVIIAETSRRDVTQFMMSGTYS
ncbi:unnamed protein product [Hymenolepis diminuta]|uniref:Ovule protein n=1 Tax=Hymenolepis diminuta TaxID=6216 RepID=A0A0R3SSH9_HYMDI|nr:unnamed protein product [Hymenolepis diminuta]